MVLYYTYNVFIREALLLIYVCASSIFICKPHSESHERLISPVLIVSKQTKQIKINSLLIYFGQKTKKTGFSR